MAAAGVPIADALPVAGARPRLAPAARATLARLRDADQAADHVAAGADRGLRDGRRRPAVLRASGRCWRWWSAAALACGGASALNHVLDRDIDRLMGPRTASRPVAAGRISPRARGGLRPHPERAVLRPAGRGHQPAGGGLAVSGGVFYVLVYTRLAQAPHERRTSSSAAQPGRSRRWPGWAAAHGEPRASARCSCS